MSYPLRLVLPIPPRELHPNARPHYRTKARLTRRCRERTRTETFALQPPRLRRAVLHVHWFWPDKRPRDTFDACASLKAYIDGMVDGGAIVDDSWQHMSVGNVSVSVDQKNPRVELTLEAA